VTRNAESLQVRLLRPVYHSKHYFKTAGRLGELARSILNCRAPLCRRQLTPRRRTLAAESTGTPTAHSPRAHSPYWSRSRCLESSVS
jgi:hypothetical protein